MENQVKNGIPANTKSLLAFLFNQMDRLNRGEIDANTACAQAKLASQTCNLLNYELKRAVVEMKLKETGGLIQGSAPRLREIESKAFDDAVSM